MIVRSTDVCDPDIASARVFFRAVLDFYGRQDTALDMFARDGQLTVFSYAHMVKDLDVWELNECHREALLRFHPRELWIGCSYARLQEVDRKYDLIVVDSPQGLHKAADGRVHAEHFDVVQQIGEFVGERAIVVLYVNKNPYDRAVVGSHGYDEYEEYDFEQWMLARAQFYQGWARRITEEQALAAYRRHFAAQRLNVASHLLVPCFSDVPGVAPYAFRLALEVHR